MHAELVLAWRLVARQWRAGDLRLMAGAAMLAVAVVTLLAAFGDRLERGLVSRAADLLGADLVLAGTRPPSDDALAIAARHGLLMARAVDFSTMLAGADAGDDAPTLLVSVRAAADGYPLRGELRTGEPGADGVASHGPRPGEIWIEPRVRDELGIDVGARVAVGYATLTVTALLAHEPDRAADFSAFSPRALMHQADLDATRVIQPGSRVRYRTLFAGNSDALAAARQELESLRAPHEELIDVQGGSRRTATALSRTLQFLSLTGVLGVVLCGAAIGIAADRQSRRLYDTAALLRTFGLPQRALQRVLVLQVMVLALATGIAGTLAGLAAQGMLARLLTGLLPAALPPPGITPALVGLATAFIAVPAFALPPLARLATVSPLRVLRRDLDPPTRRTAAHYALGLGLLALLVVGVADDRTLAATLLGATLLLIAVTVPLAVLLLRVLRHLRPRLSLPLRLAADRLAFTPWRFGAQLAAFALIIATMTLTGLLRDDLFATWQKQLPADAPNLFAVNLLPHERDDFLALLAARDIAAPPMYPVTPGRLVRIGDAPLAERVPPDSDAARSLDRDIILTQGAIDPDSVTDGEGWDLSAAPGLVSVEERLAGRMGLAIGERLVFIIEGREVSVTVAGFRRVDWDSFRPNFFMILSPGTLGDAPYTWLASFRADDPVATTRALRAGFPSLSVIEIGPLLERMGTFVGTMARGIEFVLVLMLLAALLLLAASVAAGMDERLAEAAVLRVLGARRRLLRVTLLAEFALLGLLAGLLAMVATEAARSQLYERVLDLAWTPLGWPWLLVPLAAATLLALVGLAAARGSLAADAGRVLKEG